MNDQHLAAQTEALLFALGKPLSRSDIAGMLACEAGELETAIRLLAQSASARGAVIVDDGTTLELRVSSTATDLIERIRKDEYARDIGKAGLEVLAAILYRGPLSRSEIDFIRGVNSSQTVRTLLMRGLVRKAASQKMGARQGSFVYEPTTELLATLGLNRASDLPDYTDVRDKLIALEAAYRQAASTNRSDSDTSL